MESRNIDITRVLPLVKTSLLWVVVGKKGYGKSTLTAEIISLYIRKQKRRRFIVFDTRLGLMESLRPLGFQVSRISSVKPIPWESVLLRYPKLLVYTEGLTPEEVAPHLDDLSTAVLALGDCLVWFDEAHQFYPSPEQRASKGLRLLVRDSRKRAVDLGFTTQIVVDLAISALKEADLLCIFRVTEQNEIERLARYIPLERINALGRFQYLAVDLLHGRMGQGRTKP